MRSFPPSLASRARACLCMALAALLSACGGDESMPTQAHGSEISIVARVYLDSALNLMQTYSVRRNEIDWPAFRAEAHAHAGPAQDRDDTHHSIRTALRHLGDGHSSLTSPGAVLTGQSPRISPTGTVLADGRIGYVRMPFFSDTAATAHAMEYHALLRKLDSPSVCGWIVDLRNNRGGNMWPMLVGIGPILGEGTAGAFVDADGQRLRWGYVTGGAMHDGRLYFPIDNPYTLRRPDPPVAVLTANPTVSSGEAIAIAFRGRPRTRTFGTPTRGLTTGNRGFLLPDYAILSITSTYLADRAGATYNGQLAPDVTVDAPEGSDPARDAVAAAAQAWLAGQPPCAP
ncbi:MAG TPA: S41 family peptidase [Longimicrobium sp.]|nr:S41 family peptidase [Longimicrobium sp.]